MTSRPTRRRSSPKERRRSGILTTISRRSVQPRGGALSRGGALGAEEPHAGAQPPAEEAYEGGSPEREGTYEEEEEDDLWFEKGPPQDFDFEDEER